MSTHLKGLKRLTMQAITPTSLSTEEAYNKFILRCRMMNLSDATIKYYQENWHIFSRFLKLSNILSVSEITLNTIDSYKIFLLDSELKHVSVRTRIRAIRTIMMFFQEKGWIPMFKIENIKAGDTVKEIYTDAELAKILRKPNLSNTTFTEYRNWVIVSFFLATGCRLRTLVNIKISDIDFENGMVTYSTTKNRKHQLVPLPTSILSILNEYLQYRLGFGSDYLFCNTYGNQFKEGGLQQAIRSYNRSRGVEKTSIHALRHTFAKKAIENGMDVFRLQKILGHSTLEMTRNYVNLFGSDLKNGYDSVNPFQQFTSQNGINKTSIKLKN